MNLQSKKAFAMVAYENCRPEKCSPENGICAAVAACEHKVIKQMDGVFQSPMIFQHLCTGCWDCIAACALDAVYIKHVT